MVAEHVHLADTVRAAVRRVGVAAVRTDHQGAVLTLNRRGGPGRDVAAVFEHLQHGGAVRATGIHCAIGTHVGNDVARGGNAGAGELGQAGGDDVQRGAHFGDQADAATAHGQSVITGLQHADVHLQADWQHDQVEQALSVTGGDGHPGAAGVFHLQGEAGVVEQCQHAVGGQCEGRVSRGACCHRPGVGLGEPRQ
ncbi:hypothetical protein D3C80_1220410 [compost metagenome]